MRRKRSFVETHCHKQNLVICLSCKGDGYSVYHGGGKCNKCKGRGYRLLDKSMWLKKPVASIESPEVLAQMINQFHEKKVQ